MSDAVRYSIALVAVSAALMVVIANRPEKRPGNLAPIQLITAVGAWSLIVVNAVVVGVACAAGSVSLAVAPLATLMTAAIRLVYGAGHRTSARAVPEPFAASRGEADSPLAAAADAMISEIAARTADELLTTRS